MGNTPYTLNAEIILTSLDSGTECSFVILEKIGSGTMSVCFKARKKLLTKNTMQRKKFLGEDTTRLIFAFLPKYLEHGSEAYLHERDRFISSLQCQCMLANYDETVNQSAPLLDLYEEKVTGVLWAETTWINAVALSSKTAENTDLMDFLKTISHLFDAVSSYHKRGFLLLGLNPQNVQVYTRGSGVEGVRLYDFGTMVKNDVLIDEKKRSESLVSYNRKWSAPELISGNDLSLINEKADAYSIGLILFKYLYDVNLPITSLDVSHVLQNDLAYCKTLNGAAEKSSSVRLSLRNLLCGMLQADPNKRMNIADAKKLLSAIIDEISLGTKHFLNKAEALIPRTASKYIPGFRKEEIKAIHDALIADAPLIVVQGTGGVGKSELVLEFAQEYSFEYDLYYLTYEKSLMHTLLKLPFYPSLKSTTKLKNGQLVGLTEEEMYREVRRCLSGYSKQTLLIIDNLDSEGDTKTCDIQRQPEYRNLLDLPISVVATSRFEGFEGAATIKVTESPELARKLLKKYLPNLTTEQIERLISAVDCNILCCDIIGKILKESMRFKSGITVESMLAALSGNKDGISEFEPVRVEYRKDNEERGLLDHLSRVFNLAGLNDSANSLLKFTSFFPINGILKSLLTETLRRSEYWNSYKELVKTGWIREKQIGDTEKVYLHPAIIALIKQISDDRQRALCAYMPLFAKAFKNHVDDETMNPRKYHRLFAEDLSFAECFAGLVLNEIKSDSEMPLDVVDSTASLYVELSQHYYHNSERSDIRLKFLTISEELLKHSFDRKSGNDKVISSLELARVIFYRGIANYNLNRFDLLEADCDRAISLLDSIESNEQAIIRAKGKLLSQIYGRLGDVKLSQGKLEEALDIHDKNIVIAKTLGRTETGIAYRFKGIALGDSGEIVEALRLFKKAIDSGDTPLRAYNCAGLYVASANLYDVARISYFHAFKEWEAGGRSGNPLLLYFNIVNCYGEIGRFNEAKDWAKTTIYEHFHESGKETADEIIKLLEPDTQNVNVHPEDPHWNDALAPYVCLSCIRMLCFRDGNKVNRHNVELLIERAVSSSGDSIKALYYDLISFVPYDEEKIRKRAKDVLYNKQTAAYLLKRIGVYFILTREYEKAYKLGVCAYQLNEDYHYVLGTSTSVDLILESAEALSIPVSQEILDRGAECTKKLESEKERILKLKNTEFKWLFE